MIDFKNAEYLKLKPVDNSEFESRITSMFVNGESMGIRKTRGGVHAEWLVPYQPGEIRAMGMNNGIPVCGDSVKTTGAPKGLRITRNDEEAWLFTCECIDEEGNPVPDASPLVRFYAEGMKIVGTGSDNADPVPPASYERKMYMGKIAVYARPQEGAECLRLFARADGLESAEWILEYENKNDQEALV